MTAIGDYVLTFRILLQIRNIWLCKMCNSCGSQKAALYSTVHCLGALDGRCVSSMTMCDDTCVITLNSTVHVCRITVCSKTACSPIALQYDGRVCKVWRKTVTLPLWNSLHTIYMYHVHGLHVRINNRNRLTKSGCLHCIFS